MRARSLRPLVKTRAFGMTPPIKKLKVNYCRAASHHSRSCRKRRAAMAILRLLLSTQFGESFLNLWKVKQRIVSKPARAARNVENNSFGRSAKCSQCLSIPRRGQHANKSPGAALRRNHCEVRAARERCWLRHSCSLPPSAADRWQCTAPNGRPARHPAHPPPGPSHPLSRSLPEHARCTAPPSSARSLRTWNRLRPQGAGKRSPGCFQSRSAGAAAPAKSRSLPAFEVAIKIRRIRFVGPEGARRVLHLSVESGSFSRLEDCLLSRTGSDQPPRHTEVNAIEINPTRRPIPGAHKA